MRITKEYVLKENRTIELAIPEIEEMLIALVLAVYNGVEQTVMLKSMVLDSGWFDSDWTKFEDWWREIWLFLKRNWVIVTDDKITAVLAWLRRDIAKIYI